MKRLLLFLGKERIFSSGSWTEPHPCLIRWARRGFHVGGAQGAVHEC